MKKQFAVSFTSILFSKILFMGCSQETSPTGSLDHFPEFYKEGHRGSREALDGFSASRTKGKNYNRHPKF